MASAENPLLTLIANRDILRPPECEAAARREGLFFRMTRRLLRNGKPVGNLYVVRQFFGDFRVSPALRVLIVDESAESREILRTLLERRGALTIEAQRPDQAVKLTDLHHPDLIVLDAESDHSDSGADTDKLQDAAERNAAPIVILGTVRARRDGTGNGQILSKPYHYGQLIRKIEDLLDAA